MAQLTHRQDHLQGLNWECQKICRCEKAFLVKNETSSSEQVQSPSTQHTQQSKREKFWKTAAREASVPVTSSICFSSCFTVKCRLKQSLSAFVTNKRNSKCSEMLQKCLEFEKMDEKDLRIKSLQSNCLANCLSHEKKKKHLRIGNH